MVQEARRKAALPSAVACAALECTPQYLDDVERGEAPPWSVLRMVRFMDLLHPDGWAPEAVAPFVMAAAAQLGWTSKET